MNDMAFSNDFIFTLQLYYFFTYLTGLYQWLIKITLSKSFYIRQLFTINLVTLSNAYYTLLLTSSSQKQAAISRIGLHFFKPYLGVEWSFLRCNNNQIYLLHKIMNVYFWRKKKQFFDNKLIKLNQTKKWNFIHFDL